MLAVVCHKGFPGLQIAMLVQLWIKWPIQTTTTDQGDNSNSILPNRVGSSRQCAYVCWSSASTFSDYSVHSTHWMCAQLWALQHTTSLTPIHLRLVPTWDGGSLQHHHPTLSSINEMQEHWRRSSRTLWYPFWWRGGSLCMTFVSKSAGEMSHTPRKTGDPPVHKQDDELLLGSMLLEFILQPAHLLTAAYCACNITSFPLFTKAKDLHTHTHTQVNISLQKPPTLWTIIFKQKQTLQWTPQTNTYTHTQLCSKAGLPPQFTSYHSLFQARSESLECSSLSTWCQNRCRSERGRRE